MRFLRAILGGLVAVAAMLAVFFTAVVVVLAGLAAYVVQLFRSRTGADQPDTRPRTPGGRTTMRTDDAIDVVTTKVPDDPPGR